MNPQMEILLQIQDLKGQRKELSEGDAGRRMQEEEFHLDIATALSEIGSRIEALESELDPQVRRRYDRLARSLNRVVVPAINGTCYGCFVSVATAVASDPRERKGLRTCDHCGRFLYFVR